MAPAPILRTEPEAEPDKAPMLPAEPAKEGKEESQTEPETREQPWSTSLLGCFQGGGGAIGCKLQPR